MRYWTYEEAFKRNLGLINPYEQEKLRHTRVSVAGAGGVGGIHLATLARMGIGNFTIIDPDTFDVVNTNRQYGATLSGIGRPKAQVMAEVIKDINPQINVSPLCVSLCPENMSLFLEDADLVVDSLDAFETDLRRQMYRSAAEAGIPVFSAGPVGFGTAWLAFDPDGMSFDDYFALKDGMSPLRQFSHFIAGVSPVFFHREYVDPSYLNLEEQTGPCVSSACQLAAGVVASDVVKYITGRGRIRYAPCFGQFDPYLGKFVKGKLRWGNRGPIQRLKCLMIERIIRG